MKLNIIILIIGVMLLMNHYHTIDLIYNAENIQYDKTLSGKLISLEKLYSYSWIQLFLSFIFISYSMYNIGKNEKFIKK